MQPSSRAMLWYFWRLSRWNILLFSALSVAVALFIWNAGWWTVGYPKASRNLTAQALLMAALGAGLFLRGGEKSFLPHPCLLTLPLASWRNVVLFYGYMTAVVGVVACAATALHFQVFENADTRGAPLLVFALWRVPLLCVALASLVRSMFHLAGLGTELRVMPMAVVLEFLAFLCVVPLLDTSNVTGHLMEWTAFASIFLGLAVTKTELRVVTRAFALTVLSFLCVILVLDPGDGAAHRVAWTVSASMLFAWACSYNALCSHRNGQPRQGAPALLERILLGKERNRPFSSPDSALFWLHWRRYGRVYPLCALGLGLVVYLLFSGIVLFAADEDGRASFRAALILNIPIVSLYAIVGSPILCHLFLLIRTREDLLGADRGYYLALPVRSAAFARGRLLAMTVSVALVAATMVFLFESTSVRGIETSFMFWGFLLFTWLMLWFGPLIVCAYAALFPLFQGIFLLLYSNTNSSASFVLNLPVFLLFLYIGVRHKIMAPLDLALALLTVLLAAGAALTNMLEFPPDCPPTLSVLFQFYTFLCIALPFVVTPVVMDWIRHR